MVNDRRLPPEYRFTKEEKAALRPDLLLEAAQQAWLKAYNPYSNYRVGVAIRTADGSVFQGCNVECIDYLVLHAEVNAIGSMVLAGKRDPVMIAIVGNKDHAHMGHDNDFDFPRPCGSCRQKLWEFAQYGGNDIKIVTPIRLGMPGDDVGYIKLSDLLPDAFGPADLGITAEQLRQKG